MPIFGLTHSRLARLGDHLPSGWTHLDSLAGVQLDAEVTALSAQERGETRILANEVEDCDEAVWG